MKTSNITKYFTILVLLSTLALSGCTTMLLTKVEDLKDDEVVFIGKIKLSPELEKEEVHVAGFLNKLINGDRLHTSFYVNTTDEYYEADGGIGYDFQNTIPTTIGEDFYIARKRDKTLIILGGSFQSSISSSPNMPSESVEYTIKDGIKVSYKRNAKVVYIGTITFKRDEFFELEDITISQKGFSSAKKRFRKKFGVNWKVVKGKLTDAI